MMISNYSVPQSLIELIEKVKQNDDYITALDRFKDKYNIQATNVNFLTPEKVLQTYSTIKKKFYYERKSPANSSWFENQLRIYIWALICYLFVNQREIQQMVIFSLLTQTLEDWTFFKPIFYQRDPIILQFQGILLLKVRTSKWEEDQISLLDKIVKYFFIQKRIKTLKNKWNAIARQLYIMSKKKFIKTPKQCRQRWLNYLDPSKVHCPWTSQQDIILLSSIRDNGKRWAYTVKRLLKKRTQHMVKNRFNSLINHEKKKIGNKAQSQLVLSAIETVKQAMVKEGKTPSYAIQEPVKIQNEQFGESNSESLFVIKKKKTSGKKKIQKKSKDKKGSKKIHQMETLACIPSETNIQKKHEIPAEINNRKNSEDHEPLEFFEQKASIIGFNPFEEFSLNEDILAPSMLFYNDPSSEYHQKREMDLEEKIENEDEGNYVFY